MSGAGNLSNYEYTVDLVNSTSEEAVHPVRLITGDDLIRLGFMPGPHFRTILEELESLQMEGSISTKEEAKALLAGHVRAGCGMVLPTFLQ